jgi:hypothetical protein
MVNISTPYHVCLPFLCLCCSYALKSHRKLAGPASFRLQARITSSQDSSPPRPAPPSRDDDDDASASASASSSNMSPLTLPCSGTGDSLSSTGAVQTSFSSGGGGSNNLVTALDEDLHWQKGDAPRCL